MLRSQNLSRSHQGSLISVFNGDDCGLQGDDGLAGADISLKQAAHGRGRLHVIGNFAQHALLRGGGFERQKFFERLADLSVSANAMPGRSRILRRFSSKPTSRKKNSSKISRLWAGVAWFCSAAKPRLQEESGPLKCETAVQQVQAAAERRRQAVRNLLRKDFAARHK